MARAFKKDKDRNPVMVFNGPIMGVDVLGDTYELSYNYRFDLRRWVADGKLLLFSAANLDAVLRRAESKGIGWDKTPEVSWV